MNFSSKYEDIFLKSHIFLKKFQFIKIIFEKVLYKS